jgi:excisionase family DNA binding protein
MADELLTTAEVARMLRVNRATVTRYARLGLLPFVRLPSGVYRFRREDIEALLRRESVE